MSKKNFAVQGFFDEFTNVFSKQLTLRNELIPMWETMDNMELGGEIETDKNRAEYYKSMKLLIDEFYKDLINSVLRECEIDWNELSEALVEARNDNKKINIDKIKAKYRKEICNIMDSYTVEIDPVFAIKKYENGKKSPIIKVCSGADFISEILPKYIESKYKGTEYDENLKLINSFKNFTTYFTNFWEARKNIFTSEDKATAISSRAIFNFERFNDNLSFYNNVLSKTADNLERLEKKLIENNILEDNVSLKEVFSINYFNKLLIQENIDKYNTILGGFSKEGKIKVKGINEIINEWNQVNKKDRIPMLLPLYKQILSESKTNSFSIDMYTEDKEVIDDIEKFHTLYIDTKEKDSLFDLMNLFNEIDEYDKSKIYIKSNKLTKISNDIFSYIDKDESISNWKVINLAIEEFGKTDDKDLQKRIKNYLDKINKDEDNTKSKIFFSIDELNEIIEKFVSKNNILCEKDILNNYICNCIDVEDLDKIKKAYNDLMLEFENKSGIKKSERMKQALKLYLDLLKKLENTFNIFAYDENVEVDMIFYSKIKSITDKFVHLDSIYNKTRSYITKKDYNRNKFKINFKSADLMTGWSESKIEEKRGMIFRKENQYFLAVLNKDKNGAYKRLKASIVEDGEYEKMVYSLFPDVKRMIPKCSLISSKKTKEHFKNREEDFVVTDKFAEPFRITKEIFDLYNTEYDGKKKFQTDYLKNTGDKEGYREALNKWIDFCKNFLSKYQSTLIYDYSTLKKAEQYSNCSLFYEDIDALSYKLEYEKISDKYVRESVKNGDLFLFRIYNKDFSKCSKGKKNLHTMYFEAAFSEENRNKKVFKLNGNAEVFFREKQKDPNVIHKVGEKMVDKIDLDGKRIPDEYYKDIFDFVNSKKNSIEDKEASDLYESGKVVVKDVYYDIIKDRRYTQDKMYFHVPITINYTANTNVFELDRKILEKISNTKGHNVLGIDRGERNLIYISVVDDKGHILEQKSLNIIDNVMQKDKKDVINSVDYNDILEKKSIDRDNERKSWDTIEKIKDIKEGYLSQVVHEICKLAIKYDAIIVMEDLNLKFKDFRKKVDKQVYQKFENALIKKLNYLVFKSNESSEPGGVFNAYQLARPISTLKEVGKQCGIIFYVDAKYTSKIDPTTGFTKRFRFGEMATKEKRRDFINKFDKIAYDSKMDMFYFDFDYKNFYDLKLDKTSWRVYTNGNRLIYNRLKNIVENIDLTESMKKIFGNDEAIYKSEDLKEKILNDDKKIAKVIKILDYTTDMRVSNAKEDHIISPVINSTGKFYHTKDNAHLSLPIDADANGAYNIALKGHYLVNTIVKNKEIVGNENFKKKDLNLVVNINDWIEFIQKING